MANPTISRILFAEDDELHRAVAEIMFANLGYNVDFAINGAEAIDLFAINKYTIIFLDIEMPVCNGIDAAIAIRRMEKKGGRTPIYAMTAHTGGVDQERCKGAGMDDFLSKPVPSERIERIIKNLLQNPSAQP